MRQSHITLLRYAFLFVFSIGSMSSGWSANKATTVVGVDLLEFPANKQLFPRNIYTNKASITISGKAYNYSSYEQIRVKIFRDGQTYNILQQNLNYVGNQANFSFTFSIDAELKNYDIQVLGVDNGNETIEGTAADVVAGDVYMINGQSNAQANASNHPDDYDQFSRSYTSSANWQIINQSFPGQWGARIAKEIIDSQGIPVAIFNDAVGAQGINFYLKNNSNPNSGNYGAQMNRLEAAGVRDNVRAAFWFQGETDGWTLSTQEYKSAFVQLYNAWKADYDIEHCYLFQLRRFSCSHPDPYIMEAQRQVANDIYDLDIMSTNNANHDGCHFSYYGGYQTLGNRMYALMAKDLYGQSSYEVRSPDISEASISGNQIVIEMNDAAGLNVIGNPWSDFDLGNANASVSSGYVSGTNIHLQISGDISDVNGVSYYGHPGNANNWITNTQGVGILAWHDFSVNGGGGGGGGSSTPDCNAISVSTGSNSITISGLNEAPVVQAQIFNSNWSQVFNCTNNCSSSETINLPQGNYQIYVKLYDANWNQICQVDEQATLGTTVVDNDNDGVPQDQDCNDNNPDIPTSPGSSCNDGNSNTNNDVIQSDGCTCAGTPGGGGGDPDCDNIGFNIGSNSLSITNLDQSPIQTVQVFNQDWSLAYNCTNCEATENISLASGSYYVYAKLYDSNWNIICQKNETVDINGNTGGGGINCDNTTISTSSGQIQVSGLQSAPISKLQVFNDDWNEVFVCLNDCSDTEILSLSQGEYHVFVKFFDSNWQEVCAKNETVQLGNGGGGGTGPSNGVDLELTLEANLIEFTRYSPVIYTLTLKNNGNTRANAIEVDFDLPNGTSYTTHSVSAGSYSAWDGEWTVNQLNAGQSVVLQLTAFVLTDNVNLSAFAQVKSQAEDDSDSTPNNNYNGIASEDDEASLSLHAEDRSNNESIAISLDQNRFLMVDGIYPNPASEKLNLQVSANVDADLGIRIYNISGSLQKAIDVEILEGFNLLKLDVVDLPSGMYAILFEGANRHAPIRFVKVRF